MKIYINVKYSTNLDFKDGKIKYEIADLEMDTHAPNGDPYPFLYRASGMVWALYNKDGTPVKKQSGAREQLEIYLNEQVAAFIKGIQTPASKGDF